MLTLVLKKHAVHQRFYTIPDQHINNVQEAQVFEVWISRRYPFSSFSYCILEKYKYKIFLKNLPDPISKFLRIGDRRRQQNDVDMLWKHDDYLLPNNTSLIAISTESNVQPNGAQTSASFT